MLILLIHRFYCLPFSAYRLPTYPLSHLAVWLIWLNTKNFSPRFRMYVSSRYQSSSSDSEDEENRARENERIAQKLKDYLNKKISAANAFEMPILDSLPEAIKVQSIRSVGAMLDASAKVYACRVDNTYGSCYKVLSTADGDKTRFRQIEEEELEEAEEEGETTKSVADDAEAEASSSEVNAEKEVEAIPEEGTSNDAEEKPAEEKQKKKRKNKDLFVPLEIPARCDEMAKKTHKMASDFIKMYLEPSDDIRSEEQMKIALLQYTKDITNCVDLRRVGIPRINDKPGALDRNDSKYSIEDAIYRKVSKEFEEGSAKSFVSNEVLTNKSGNFLILHNNWPGNEPRQVLPLVCKHIDEPDSERQLVAQFKSTVARALQRKPSQYPLLTQIGTRTELNIVGEEVEDAEEAPLPKIDFHLDQASDEIENDAEAFALEESLLSDEQNNNKEVENDFAMGKMDVDDDGIALNGIHNGLVEDEFAQTEENVADAPKEMHEIDGLEGDAFGPEMAAMEMNLMLMSNEEIEPEEPLRLINVNLPPPIRTPRENVSLKEPRVEDNSHWKASANPDLQKEASHEATPLRKTRQRKNTAKSASTKRRGRELLNTLAENDAEETEDMCWMPQKLVSTTLKKAIEKAQASQYFGGKKRVQFDALQFSPRKLAKARTKNMDMTAYDPLELLRAKMFNKSLFGIWTYVRKNGGSNRRLRFVPHLRPPPPFGSASSTAEQYTEFTRVYLALHNSQKCCDESMAAEPLAFDEFDDGGISLNNTRRKHWNRDEELVEDVDLDTGFGFLNNVTLREIINLNQSNFDVANVKKALLKVISSAELESFKAARERAAALSMEEVISSVSDSDSDGSDAEEEEAVEGEEEAFNIENLKSGNGIESRDLFVHLSHFLHGLTKKNLNVVSAFAVMLHVCNDKQLMLSQSKDVHGEMVSDEGMKGFVVTGGTSTSEGN